MGKTYSYKLPEVINVKYLSFADFTGNKNVFYFNCPDDCDDSSNNSPASGTFTTSAAPFFNCSDDCDDSSNNSPASGTFSFEASSNSNSQSESSSGDNDDNDNAESKENKTLWQRFTSWFSSLFWNRK